MDYWGGGGGGGQRVCWAPSRIIEGPGPPCPPSSYAYELYGNKLMTSCCWFLIGDFMVELIVREQDALIMCLHKNVLCLQKQI